jgi:hypothetical protein
VRFSIAPLHPAAGFATGFAFPFTLRPAPRWVNFSTTVVILVNFHYGLAFCGSCFFCFPVELLLGPAFLL